jgi:hypothetical protein
MRKVAVLFLAMTLTLSGQVASAGDEIEWRPVQWSSTQQYVINILGLGESDLAFGGNPGSILQYNSPTPTGYSPIKCEFYGDSICTSNRLDLQASVVMPKCEGEATTWCIREFSAIDSTGLPVTATFIKYVEGSGYPKNSEIGLPVGGRISIWRLNTQKDSDPLYYALKFGGAIRWFTGKPFYFQSSGSIFPIRIDKNPSYKAMKLTSPDGRFINFQSGLKCENAIYLQDGECGVLDTFPENTGFKVSFVVPNSITGFLSARIMKPTIASSPTDSKNKVITIQGSPLRIPRLGLALTRDQALVLNPNLGAYTMNYGAFDNRQDGYTLKELNILRDFSGDKSTGNSRVWNFATLDSSNSSIAGFDANGKTRIDYSAKCKISLNQLLGSVSTNAMVLDPGPPNFVDGEFVYNVAGMHYETDGVTPFKGYYSLKIAKSLAKCLYKNDGVPVRAIISILDESGVSQSVRTESVTDDGDYYAMELSGFTFSKPIIHVKYEFGNTVKATPAPVTRSPTVTPTTPATPTPSVTPVVAKKLTITCIKGKLVKKVTAVKPVCPKGYKK